MSAAPFHDDSAEDALLGAAMLTTEAADIVCTLEPEDFDPGRTKIVEAIQRLRKKGSPVDATTVAGELGGHLDQVGGGGRLVALLDKPARTTNARAYADRIVEQRRRRKFLTITDNLRDAAITGTDPGPALTELARHTQDDTAPEIVLEDIAAALDRRHPDAPELLIREDGPKLLYAKAVNALVAEPTAGKTTIACMACLQVIEAGGQVLFVDFEDVVDRVVARMSALGASRQQLLAGFHYVRPAALTDTGAAQLLRIVTNLSLALVIIDGVAESMAAQGLDEDVAGDVARWWGQLPRPLAATGAAVLILDHVPKSKENRGRYARGSGAKLAAIDGVSYTIEVRQAFSRSTAGQLRLVIAKDRPGSVGATGDTAAVIDLTPHNEGQRLTWRIGPPAVRIADQASSDGPPVSPERRAAVLELLNTEGTLSFRKIARNLRAAGLKFSDETLRVTLIRMATDGDLHHEPGPNRTDLYSLPAHQPTLDDITP